MEISEYALVYSRSLLRDDISKRISTINKMAGINSSNLSRERINLKVIIGFLDELGGSKEEYTDWR